jgi:hypothetical protein
MGDTDSIGPRKLSLNMSLIPNLTDLVFLEDELEFFQTTVLIGVFTPNRTLMKVFASLSLIVSVSSAQYKLARVGFSLLNAF